MTVTGDLSNVRMLERLDSRVLGALRFADAATRCWIVEPLSVTATDAVLIRNRSGAYVIATMKGLESQVTEFAARPSTPAVGSVMLKVSVADLSGHYLPRTVQVALPRTPEPEHAANESSLFSAVTVPLYPGPAAAIYPGWAVVRASVKRGASDVGVPYAWLRLRRASQPVDTSPPLAVGMADARGEALIAVSGIPVTNWDVEGGALLATELDAVIDAYADAEASFPPDPDAIESKIATLPSSSRAVMLASGRQSIAQLQLTIP